MNTHNLQQEFDDVFNTSFLPKVSRQNSVTTKSKLNSEPVFDIDEDFAVINNLIHQRVNEPTTSQPNPFFKDVSYVDPAHINKPLQNPFGRSIPLFNDPQIADIIGETATKEPKMQSHEEETFFKIGNTPMPEGWVNLLRSLERDPLNPPYQQTQSMYNTYDTRTNFQFSQYLNPNMENKSSSGNSGSIRGISEADSKENEDRSLEKNPYYKLKSKKEFEEERKRKQQQNKQANPPPQTGPKNTQPNITKEKEWNNPQKIDENRTPKQTTQYRKPSNTFEEEYSGYNNYYNKNAQWKTMPTKGSVETPLNKKIPEPTKKPEIQKNVNIENQSLKKDKVQNVEEGKKPLIGKEIPKQNNLETNVKIEEVRKGREREEKRPIGGKEQKKEIKQEETKPSKDESSAQIKIEKETTTKIKQEKGIEKGKKQEEVIKIEKEIAQKKVNENEKERKEKRKEVKEEKVELVGEKSRNKKEEVSQEQAIEEEKVTEQEEFITLKKTKKKNKGNKDKNESKKQVLVGTVKKETEKLLQNQFAALQASAQNITSNKETIFGESEDFKEENVFSSTKEVSQKDKKSKKKKKAEKKQANFETTEKPQEVKTVPVIEEVKEENKEQVNVNKKGSSDKSIKVPAETKAHAENKNKNKTQEKQDKNKEDKNVKTKAEQNKLVEKPPVQNKTENKKIEESQIKVEVETKVSEEQAEVKEQTKPKKKKKKNKNKDKETVEETSKEQEKNLQGKNKKDDHQKDTELNGSTDEEEGAEQIKAEAQFSKSKKKKLKKKAKQQALFECIMNAEQKIKEMRNKHFTETMAAPYYASFLNKFRQLLIMQNEQEGQGMFMREHIEEKGSFNETRIKLQVSMRGDSDDATEETIERNKKKKKKNNQNDFNEMFDVAPHDLHSFGGILSGEVEEIQIDESDSRDDFDSIMETIGYVETLIKNKTEIQAPVQKKNVEELSNLTLHELLETIEKTKFGTHDIGGGIGCFLAIN